ncbi:MAG: hypothetical protein K0V04_26035 [Deltaproteobacteria bacterium]|nr:hypothetical protein [Deltaproteobacteria bacterium]
MRYGLLAALAVCGCDVGGGPAQDDALDPMSRGEIVFVEQRGHPDFRIATLSLDTGDIETLFALPSGAFAYAVDVHPETGAVLLAYTEPDPDGPGFDRSVLVELDDEGPRYITGLDAAGTWALHPCWSADGESIWYVAQGQQWSSETLPHTLVRVRRDDNQIDVEIPWATEPAVSPTGDYMAWVEVEPESYRRKVVMGTADGDPIRTLVDQDDVYDLGTPTFSSDGGGVFVLVLESPITMRSADLSAAPEATGHGTHLLPGDWYGIAVDDTERIAISETSTIHHDATVSAAQPLLIAATREGITTVDLRTGTAEPLLLNRAIRSVAWRPGHDD